MHTQGGSMHHDDKSFLTVDKKIVQASLVNAEDNRDSVAITKPLRDGATIGTRQSLSSKAKQQKHGHRSLTDSSVDDKRAQSTDNGPSAFKQNVTVSQTIIMICRYSYKFSKPISSSISCRGAYVCLARLKCKLLYVEQS